MDLKVGEVFGSRIEAPELDDSHTVFLPMCYSNGETLGAVLK